MHREFNDDIFARFLVVMKNVVISFIKEYEGPTFEQPCDVIIMKNNFYGIIWDDLFIYEVKLKLCLIFQKIFKMGAILSLFSMDVIPVVGYTRKIAINISDILSF